MSLEEALKDLIPAHMARTGFIVRKSQIDPLEKLVKERKIPDIGWNSNQIRQLLMIFASMDTDKDPKAARIGEREARVSSSLISELAAGFNHGVGRGGNLTAPQPKAPGASMMYNVANLLALDALRIFGCPSIEDARVFPLSTGMALAVTLAALRPDLERSEVVYPRIDHVSPKKGIRLAGLIENIVNGIVKGDAVVVEPGEVRRRVTAKTAAILSTTTFFPPREPDRIGEIAEIAQQLSIPHIINNAYGVQSEKIMHNIERAVTRGRVDAIIQSTDKNFLTPVGGSIIASPDKEILEKISQTYAGRATAAPIVQFLASILKLGRVGYRKLREKQKANHELLRREMDQLASKHGERILEVENDVAWAMSLSMEDPTRVGRYLYSLRVTGPRVVKPGDFGSCCDSYPIAYMTMNAAIGARRHDILTAIHRLDKAMFQASSHVKK